MVSSPQTPVGILLAGTGLRIKCKVSETNSDQIDLSSGRHQLQIVSNEVSGRTSLA